VTLDERIEEAIRRITGGLAPMRIPADPSDPDVVLVDCRTEIRRAHGELAAAKIRAEQAERQAARIFEVLTMKEERLKAAAELARRFQTYGHEGDEETGEHFEDCQACVKEALQAALDMSTLASATAATKENGDG
jgi:hypothetical protein